MMRISTAFYFQTGLNSLNRQQGDLVHTFQQLGSGKRMITAADDPLAAAQTLSLGQAESMNIRLSENREVAMRSLAEEENALMSLIPQVNAVKTRLVEVSNGTLDLEDRKIIAEVLTEMRDSIHDLMNSKDGNGQFLFSGSKGTTEPFQLTNGVYGYEGDERARLVQVDQTRPLDSADHGKDVFVLENADKVGAEDNLLNVMTDVINALNNDDPNYQETLKSAMRFVDKSYNQILTVRASVGARMNEIEAIDDSGTMQRLHITSEISRLEDLDFYTAATQLELRSAGLQAASIAFQRIQATSLFAMNSR